MGDLLWNMPAFRVEVRVELKIRFGSNSVQQVAHHKFRVEIQASSREVLGNKGTFA